MEVSVDLELLVFLNLFFHMSILNICGLQYLGKYADFLKFTVAFHGEEWVSNNEEANILFSSQVRALVL